MNYDEPAFPVNFANDTEWPMEDPFGRELPAGSNSQYVGLTKRDYFAAKAMQGYCSNEEHCRNCTIEMTAKSAYEVADAMIEESNNDE